MHCPVGDGEALRDRRLLAMIAEHHVLTTAAIFAGDRAGRRPDPVPAVRYSRGGQNDIASTSGDGTPAPTPTARGATAADPLR